MKKIDGETYPDREAPGVLLDAAIAESAGTKDPALLAQLAIAAALVKIADLLEAELRI